MKLLRVAAGIGLAVASVLAFAAPSSAQTNWNGVYVGTQGGWVNFDVDWVNAGTPNQQLRGTMVGGNLGFRTQLGSSNVVFGAAADALFGRLTQCIRDGNYIVECGTLHGIGTIRATVGVAIDYLLIYGTAGIGWADMTQTQSCPDPAAVMFGFCKTHGPFNAAGRATLWGPVFGGGVEFAFGEERNMSMFLEVLHVRAYRPLNFGPLMGNDGDGHPISDQIVLGGSTTVQVGFRFMF